MDGDLKREVGDCLLEAQDFVEVEFADHDVCAVGESDEPYGAGEGGGVVDKHFWRRGGVDEGNISRKCT